MQTSYKQCSHSVTIHSSCHLTHLFHLSLSGINSLTSNLWDPSLTLPGQDGIPVHDTLGNLINKRFLFFVLCCLFCLFSFCLVWFTFCPSCFSSRLSNSPSFSLFLFFSPVVCTVKWPYQVPRYVWDAAPHVPTFRFGKELPSTNRLQGSSTSHAPPLPPARTVFPLAYSSANLCALAVFPLVFCLTVYFFSPRSNLFGVVPPSPSLFIQEFPSTSCVI